MGVEIGDPYGSKGARVSGVLEGETMTFEERGRRLKGLQGYNKVMEERK